VDVDGRGGAVEEDEVVEAAGLLVGRVGGFSAGIVKVSITKERGIRRSSNRF